MSKFATSRIHSISSKEEFVRLTQQLNNIPVIVDFYATWCGPCKQIAPLLEQLAQQQYPQCAFLKVDIDKQQELATQYSVSAVPTFAVFLGGSVQGNTIQGGDLQAVSQLVNQALQKCSLSAEDLKNAGNEFLAAKNLAEAVHWYGRAIPSLSSSKNDSSAKKMLSIVYANRSYCYVLLQNFAWALQDARASLRSDNTYAKGYLRKAQALIGLSHFERALKSIERGLKLEPSNEGLKKLQDDASKKLAKTEPTNELSTESKQKSSELKEQGNQSFKQGNYVAAVKYYSDAIALSALDHVLYSNRAAAMMAMNAFEAANLDLKRCLELNPSFIKAYVRRAKCLQALDRKDDAVALLDKGLLLSPHNQELLETKTALL